MKQTRPGAVGALVVAAMALAAVTLGGCGPSGYEAAQKKLDEQAIVDLRSRRVIQDLNRESEKVGGEPQPAFAPASTASAPQNPQNPQDPQRPSALAAPVAPAPADACPGIPVNPTGDQRYAAIQDLYQCFRGIVQPARAWDHAAELFRSNQVGEQLFSPLSFADLLVRIVGFTPSPRREFLPAELDELTSIYRKRREAYALAEAKVFEALRKHEAWLGNVALPGIKALLALAKNAGAIDRQINEVAAVLGTVIPTEWRKAVPLSYLTPYGFSYLLPKPGDELSRLVPPENNPFDNLLVHGAMLETVSTQERQTRGIYETIRGLDVAEVDGATLPGRVNARPDAVRVAFLDTGIDYKRQPALGRYLALGDQPFTSQDYSDGDLNPWEPLGVTQSLGHGSGTSASFLTVLSDLNDSLLQGGKLSLAMWKISTTRAVLAGPFQAYGPLWENRDDRMFKAIEEQFSKPVQPQVVSASLGFPSWEYFKVAKPDVLLTTQALLVMAAGNSGTKVEEGGRYSSCFTDFPADKRPAERILCVGALKRGVIQADTTVAGYSNYGDRVDVYTLESFYNDLCPNGTSCATPVMSAVAASVFERYPTLSAESVRRAILAASVEKEFRVEGKRETRKVRYFNPYLHFSAMMEKAGEIAATREVLLAAGPSPSGGGR